MPDKNNQKQSIHNNRETQKSIVRSKKKSPNNSIKQFLKVSSKKEAYSKIEWPKVVCEKCGKDIKDLNTALSDKNTGNPIHFDCILEFIKNSEEIKENEEVIYIGEGNFAIVFFENPKIRKKFKIIKFIEWEGKGKTYLWKDEVKQLSSST